MQEKTEAESPTVEESPEEENPEAESSETENPEAESPAVEESPEAQSPETESPVTESTSEVASVQISSEQIQSALAFGVWTKIAYEDRGAATDVKTNDLYILGDSTPYFSLEDGLSGSSKSALTPGLLLKDTNGFDLTVEASFEDTFDGSISDKRSFYSSKTYGMDDIVVGYTDPEENPTGLTYDGCYPEQFYFVHLTGTYRESPVKKSDVDTWIVYKKQYPLFNKQIYPALVGKWKDDLGNIWEFSVKEEDLAFKMTDTDGNVYEGIKSSHRSANKDKVNFFERIMFEFDNYKTDFYAVVSFDGQKLEMLDRNWDSYVLTKVE